MSAHVFPALLPGANGNAKFHAVDSTEAAWKSRANVVFHGKYLGVDGVACGEHGVA